MANVYARVREDGVVMHLFSDMFEKPKETDFLLKSGEGEEYIHVFCEGGGKISLYTYDNLFQYKIENGVMVKRGEEELEEERKERLENPDYSKIAQEVKDKLEHFLYNPTLSETKNPDNLGTGIYQYWSIFFDTSPFQVPHIILNFNAQSLRFQIGADFKGSVVFRSRGATETEWTSWKRMEDIENNLRNMGIFEVGLTSTSIREDFTFEDLIKRSTLTFFTNWIDMIHFPRPIGSGVLLPGADPRFKTILYITTGFRFNKHLFQTYICNIFIPEEGQLDEAGNPYEIFYEWTSLTDNQSTSNPNLFINSNFKICQRDMIEYVTNKTENYGRYYPDRWICLRDYNDSGLKYKIEEDGLHAYFMGEAGSWGKIEYRFDKDLSYYLSEKTITISGKIRTISDNSETRVRCFDMYNGSTIIVNHVFTKRETDNFYKATIKLPKITDTLKFNIRFSGGIGAEYIFEYLKLELGKEATLFVPPNPTEELLKCMSYYQEEEIHYRPSKEGSNLLIPVQSTRKVPMREIPNIKIYSLTGTENKFSVANGLTDTKDIISEIYNNKVGYYPAIVVTDVPVNESKVAIFKSDAEL